MNTLTLIAPAGTQPKTWGQVRAESLDVFHVEFASICMQTRHIINPDDWTAHLVEAEDAFHTASAATLGMARSPYEQAAASGRIQWCRADTAQLHPPCQIRIDGGPWHNLTEFMRP